MEYRRKVLRKRWRHRFAAAMLLLLMALISAIGFLWRTLHNQQKTTGLPVNTILKQELTGDSWNTVNYTVVKQLNVQTNENGTTAMDFRMAAVPASDAVDRSWFSQVSFLGDSLTQGMQLYEKGLKNAMFCAYKGIGPNTVVNNTACKKADGTKEVPLDALVAQQPKAVYILLGTNALNKNSDYTGFLTYYRLMIDMIQQKLPNTPIYVQSITPVRPELCQKQNYEGLNKERLCKINDELAAIALEKDCYFLNLWEVLADENGDLKAEYAQADGYHIKPDGYSAWVDYLRTHTAQ